MYNYVLRECVVFPAWGRERALHGDYEHEKLRSPEDLESVNCVISPFILYVFSQWKRSSLS
jgi:hypothetical protein